MKNGGIKTDLKNLSEYLAKPLEKGIFKWAVLAVIFIFGIILIVGGKEDKAVTASAGTVHSDVALTLEDKIEGICENVEGVGEISAAVTLSREDEIVGIGIVCDGGDDPTVVNTVLELVSAFCGVSTNKIYVAPLKNS